jgi:hypothetical protein
MTYEVKLRTSRQESEKHVVDASEYRVEGQFTTFFRSGEGGTKERIASFKTSLIESISQVNPAPAPPTGGAGTN